MQTKCNTIVFADRIVGKATLNFLLENFRQDIVAIVCTNEESLVYNEVILNNQDLVDITYFNSQLKDDEVLQKLENLQVDYSILSWWPYIIKKQVIQIPKLGTINFHPSLLPYNRGMNYNFWTIVEDTPFGVSLHFVDESIDGGDIIFQKPIEKTWEDTGATLYEKAQSSIFELFTESYPFIRQHQYKRVVQHKEEGSFHWGKELHDASKIYLNRNYTGKELLNILRARTFEPHPAAWFEDNGKTYEVRITIKTKN